MKTSFSEGENNENEEEPNDFWIREHLIPAWSLHRASPQLTTTALVSSPHRLLRPAHGEEGTTGLGSGRYRDGVPLRLIPPKSFSLLLISLPLGQFSSSPLPPDPQVCLCPHSSLAIEDLSVLRRHQGREALYLSRCLCFLGVELLSFASSNLRRGHGCPGDSGAPHGTCPCSRFGSSLLLLFPFCSIKFFSPRGLLLPLEGYPRQGSTSGRLQPLDF